MTESHRARYGPHNPDVIDEDADGRRRAGRFWSAGLMSREEAERTGTDFLLSGMHGVLPRTGS